MSTLADNLSTIMWNVQLGAMTALSAVNGVAAQLFSDEALSSPAAEMEMPSYTQAPAMTFTENTGLYTALALMKDNLENLGEGLPSLEELLGTRDSPESVLDKYKDYALGYIEDVDERFATYEKLDSYTAMPVVDTFELTATSLLPPSFELPRFAQEGFSKELTRQVQAINDVITKEMALEAWVIRTKMDAELDEMQMKRLLLAVEQKVAFVKMATEASAKLLTREFVKPEDINALYSKLTEAKASVITGITSNQSTDASIRMSYLNQLSGYYNIVERISKSNISLFESRSAAVTDANAINAKKLVGLASAASSASVAGYSAARVGFELSKKTFE